MYKYNTLLFLRHVARITFSFKAVKLLDTCRYVQFEILQIRWSGNTIGEDIILIYTFFFQYAFKFVSYII